MSILLKTSIFLIFIYLENSIGANLEDTFKTPSQAHTQLRLVAEEPSTNPIDQVVSFVKATLNTKTDEQIRSMVKKHYERFRMIKDGKWTHPKLQSLSEELFPTQMSVTDCCSLVDNMGTLAKRNPYLSEALQSLQAQDLEGLKQKALRDGAEVLPDVASYAMALEKITSSIKKDIGVLDALDEVWDQSKQSISIVKHFSPFEIVKYYGLLHLSGIKKGIKTGKVPQNYLSLALPVNILEATFSDFWCGNFENARAGWILAKNRPGGTFNEKTGSGPAFVATKGPYKLMHLRCPFPQQWADLYTTWNLAFVSNYSNFPYFMAKLLIPSVNDYSGAPGSYMYQRALALYMHVHHELFSREDRTYSPRMMGWNSTSLTKHLGRMNKKSAKKYQQLVDASEEENL